MNSHGEILGQTMHLPRLGLNHMVLLLQSSRDNCLSLTKKKKRFYSQNWKTMRHDILESSGTETTTTAAAFYLNLILAVSSPLRPHSCTSEPSSPVCCSQTALREPCACWSRDYSRRLVMSAHMRQHPPSAQINACLASRTGITMWYGDKNNTERLVTLQAV